MLMCSDYDPWVDSGGGWAYHILGLIMGGWAAATTIAVCLLHVASNGLLLQHLLCAFHMWHPTGVACMTCIVATTFDATMFALQQ